MNKLINVNTNKWLTHFITLVSFCTPWNSGKAEFFMVLGGIERVQCMKRVKELGLKLLKNINKPVCQTFRWIIFSFLKLFKSFHYLTSWVELLNFLSRSEKVITVTVLYANTVGRILILFSSKSNLFYRCFAEDFKWCTVIIF